METPTAANAKRQSQYSTTDPYASVPQELKDRDQWVIWRPEWKPGDKKSRKVPYDAKTGQTASSTDPSTWATYAEAVAAGRGMIGLVTTASDPLVCVDMNGCYCMATGRLTHTAEKIVRLLDSYAEISPSETGVKIWIRASLAKALKRTSLPWIEAYGTDRYLCVTGMHLENTPLTIEDRQEALDALVAEYRQEEPKGGKRPTAKTHPTGPRKKGTMAAAESTRLLKEALTARGYVYQEKPADDEDAYETVLELADVCLTSKDHEDGAAIMVYPDGGRSYKCHHRRCADKTWADAAPTLGLDPGHYADGMNRIEYLTTDTANGRRLIARHGERLRYADGLGWMVYDGTRWTRNSKGQVYEWAKETALGIFDEAKEAANAGDTPLAKALVKFAQGSLDIKRQVAMVTTARSEPSVAVLADDFDPNPWLFNCLNGTVGVRTGEMKAHDPADLITMIAPFEHDPEAACPVFLAFLETVIPDATTRTFLQRYVGYCLTGDDRAKAFLIAHGPTDTGKTTFVETIQALIGEEYGKVAPSSTIVSVGGAREGIPNDVARLRGARLVVVSETGEGAYLNAERVKAFTGRNKVSARFLRAEWFDFVPQFKLLIETNHRPQIHGGGDDATWNRVRLVPFNVKIPRPEQDKDLPEKLLKELPGIFNWAIKGCREWLATGTLGESEAVKQATEEYKESVDVFGTFLEEMCVLGEEEKVQSAALYAAFRGWALSKGEKEKWSDNRLAEAMKQRAEQHGFVKKSYINLAHWFDLRLALPTDREAEGEERKPADPWGSPAAGETSHVA